MSEPLSLKELKDSIQLLIEGAAEDGGIFDSDDRGFELRSQIKVVRGQQSHIIIHMTDGRSFELSFAQVR